MYNKLLAYCIACIVISTINSSASSQCTSYSTDTQDGIAGGSAKIHRFYNNCLAQPGTNVTITIEAMADLGCFAFDATHDPPSGSGCPDECASPLCCGTDPEDKYLTVSANGNWLSPAIMGSSNMPASGRFFAEWAGNCTPYSDTCNEAGRSLCDGAVEIHPNRRVVTVPASVWNSWLGANGNT